MHSFSRSLAVIVLLASAACSSSDAAPEADDSTAAAQAAAPAPPADVPAAASASGEPVLGEYACDESSWNVSAGRMDFQPRGYFVLEVGGRYRWLDNGGGGTFGYDDSTKRISWLTGPLADKQAEYSEYRRNEKTTQVDIHFTEDVEWSCGHNL